MFRRQRRETLRPGGSGGAQGLEHLRSLGQPARPWPCLSGPRSHWFPASPPGGSGCWVWVRVPPAPSLGVQMREHSLHWLLCSALGGPWVQVPASLLWGSGRMGWGLSEERPGFAAGPCCRVVTAVDGSTGLIREPSWGWHYKRGTFWKRAFRI